MLMNDEDLAKIALSKPLPWNSEAMSKWAHRSARTPSGEEIKDYDSKVAA